MAIRKGTTGDKAGASTEDTKPEPARRDALTRDQVGVPPWAVSTPPGHGAGKVTLLFAIM